MEKSRNRSPVGRLTRAVAIAAAPAFILAACTSNDTSAATKNTASTSTTTTNPDGIATTTTGPRTNEAPEKSPGSLKFESRPDTDFSVSDCKKDPDTWAVQIDSNPNDIESDPKTVGFVKGYSTDGSPVLLLGATIQGLGDYKYLVATSNAPDEVKSVDLRKQSYAEILTGSAGEYDAAFTFRDGGDQKVVPLPEPDTTPSGTEIGLVSYEK